MNHIVLPVPILINTFLLFASSQIFAKLGTKKIVMGRPIVENKIAKVLKSTEDSRIAVHLVDRNAHLNDREPSPNFAP